LERFELPKPITLSGRLIDDVGYYFCPAISSVEKLKNIEALWGDLAGDENSLPNLAWYETGLKETKEKFLAGSIEVLN
jgi:hypothetical protein